MESSGEHFSGKQPRRLVSLGGLSELTEVIPLVQVWKILQTGDAFLVDVREPSEFARGHPPGALSLPYSQRGLGTRLKTLVEQGRNQIILFAQDHEQAQGAALQLEDSSFPLIGLADGNMELWTVSDLPVETLEEVGVENLEELSSRGESVILDVREPIEWEMGHVPGALLVSLGSLRDHIADLPQNKRVVIICEAGIRSCSAASILKAAGFKNAVNIPEGTSGYRKAGLPLDFTELPL